MDTAPKRLRKINPRYKANIFSALTFGWTLETFKLGYSRDILENDLYAPLPEHKSNILGDVIEKAWEAEVQKCRDRGDDSKKPSLWKVLIKVFGAELILYGLILSAMEFLIRLQQPMFLGLLLRYYSPAPTATSISNSTYLARLYEYHEAKSSVSFGEAVFFSMGVVFCSAINIIVQHPFMMGAMHIGMKIRVGVCSLIYRKSLRVSSQSMSENSAGLVVNLMANDVNRFDTGPLFAHYLWIAPVETVLMTAYLFADLGIAAVYGALIIFAVVPFQICLGIGTAWARGNTAIKSDERVELMKEIIMGIEVIKMYTWEEPFRKIIDYARRKEIRYIKLTSYIRGVIMSFIMFTSRFGIFITALLYVIITGRIGVEKVFYLTCYYNILKQTMTLYFPQGVGQIAEMIVAVQRIRDYLLSEECQLPRDETRQLVRVEPPKKKVIIVEGPVSKRRPKSEASASVANIKVVRSNKPVITFNDASSRWIKSALDDVQHLTLEIMEGALTTVIGSVGAGKSTFLMMVLQELPCSTGSIKVDGTVSYASQEPWLFVGSVRQNILFGQQFVKSRYMEVCKVCALERDISLFPHGDKTIVGERGVSLSGGQRARINLARAVYKDADIYLLDDPLSAVDTQVSKHIFEQCIKKYLKDKTVILVTHQLQFIKSVDQIVVLNKGVIMAQGDYPTLHKQNLDIIKMMKANEKEVRESEDSAPSTTHPVTVSKFSAISTRHQQNMSSLLEFTYSDLRPESEVQTIGRVNGSIYKDYYLSGASAPLVIIVIFLFILAQFCASAGDYWISRWANAEDQMTGDATMDTMIWQEQGLTRKLYIAVFDVITLATILVALLRAFSFFTLCMRSSIKLHDKMFECISRSPMSFFHANPSGRILNRFSKDMGAIDELLPQAMIDCFQIMLNLLGVTVVIILIDMALLVPITAAIIIFYLLRLIYIRTTSAVKRLEGITRSPVFSHLNATVLGLPTVRSFGAETILIEEFDRHQDLHSSAWYLFITCSRAFGFFLDIICLLFIICVTFNCLAKFDVEGSRVGLAITQSISLTGIFQWGMRQSAEMENQMTSVERVLEYTKLVREADWRSPEETKPPSDWPHEGGIEFQNLSTKYSEATVVYVLHKIDLVVQPKEKIGIVGRTGAGKSSIIQSLFRLAYLDGKIIIDDVDITNIGLHDLREKISIIPQEPVLFSGSLRKNLDPFGEYSDQTLMSSLKAVELVTADDGFEALDKNIQAGGSNFSVGERQLVCLARAIVRKNKILLLDEATANVDAETDAMIQNAIREHFKHCTVLTIAHRLNTVMDSDKILVLDAGKVLEYDHPHLLLQNKNSNFSKMVSETGPTMTSFLKNVAQESYKNQQNKPANVS